MSKAKAMVAWESDDLRLVVVDDFDGAGPLIALERREHDALGAASWVMVALPEFDTDAAAFSRIACELVSKNEMLPLWAKKIVDDSIAHYRTHVDDDGSAA